MLPRKQTTYIVVTATMDDPPPTYREIEWRARKYGYLDAGCHFVITNDGTFECRQVGSVGVGVKPHNDKSVIITLAGQHPYSERQMSALIVVIDMLSNRYPDAQLVAHSELPGARSQAPGFDVQAWWRGWQACKAIGV